MDIHKTAPSVQILYTLQAIALPLHTTPQGPEYEPDIAARFIQSMFLERNLIKSKIIYPHFMTATNTSDIKVVLEVTLETITRENLEAANLL